MATALLGVVSILLLTVFLFCIIPNLARLRDLAPVIEYLVPTSLYERVLLSSSRYAYDTQGSKIQQSDGK